MIDSAGGWWVSGAGHCFPDGAVGSALNGQGGLYGQAVAVSFPDPDLALIGSSNRDYHRYTYVGLDPLAIRIIDGYRDIMQVGENVCLTGAFTGFACNDIRVEDVGEELCDPGCTYDLYSVNEVFLGGEITQDGDSGGPAIGRHGDDRASARGTLVGGRGCEPSPPHACTTALLHHMDTLMDEFGVQVAQAGGPGTGTPGGPPDQALD